MSIAAEQQSYQTYLEALRRNPDSEQLAEDLERAHRALKIAHLERAASQS